MTGIKNVSDTARWVAYYRGLESARPDALFRDPFADRLSGPEGRAIVAQMKYGERMAWAMVVRTVSIDEILMQKIRNDQVDLIVNLASGLDTRPWRLDLPPTLRWVDVDLPGILDYKLETMKAEKTHCQYEAIRVDLTDAARRSAVLSQLGASSTKALVITEGLLIYLEPEDVKGLAGDLAAVGGFRWWVTDIAHPDIIKMTQNSWGKVLEAAGTPFKFAPEENTKFFEPFGWKEKEFRSSTDEARRINREMRWMWLWRFIGRFSSEKTRQKFQRFSGVAVLEKA